MQRLGGTLSFGGLLSFVKLDDVLLQEHFE